MHKEDLDTKIGDKFLVENTLLTQKVKPQKEKILKEYFYIYFKLIKFIKYIKLITK